MKKTKKIVLGAVATAVPVAAVGMMAESINLNKEMHENANQVRQINKRAVKHMNIIKFRPSGEKPVKFVTDKNGEKSFDASDGTKLTKAQFNMIDWNIYVTTAYAKNNNPVAGVRFFFDSRKPNGGIRVTGLEQGHSWPTGNPYLLYGELKSGSGYIFDQANFIGATFDTRFVPTKPVDKPDFTKTKPTFKIGANPSDKDIVTFPNYDSKKLAGFYKIDNGSEHRFNSGDTKDIGQQKNLVIGFKPIGDYAWKPDAKTDEIWSTQFASPKWTKAKLEPATITIGTITNGYSKTSKDAKMEFTLGDFNSRKEHLELFEYSGSGWVVAKTGKVNGVNTGSPSIINLDAGKDYRLKIVITNKSHNEWKDGTTTDLDFDFVVNPNNLVEIKKFKPNVLTTNPKSFNTRNDGTMILPSYDANKFEVYYVSDKDSNHKSWNPKGQTVTVHTGEFYKIFYGIKGTANFVWEKANGQPGLGKKARQLQKASILSFVKTAVQEPTVNVKSEKKAYSKTSNDGGMDVSVQGFNNKMQSVLYEGAVTDATSKPTLAKGATMDTSANGEPKSIKGLSQGQTYTIVTTLKDTNNYKWANNANLKAIYTTFTMTKIDTEEITPPHLSAQSIVILKPAASTTDKVEIFLPGSKKGLVAEYTTRDQNGQYAAEKPVPTPSHMELEQNKMVKVFYTLDKTLLANKQRKYVWAKSSNLKDKDIVSYETQVPPYNPLPVNTPTIAISKQIKSHTVASKDGHAILNIQNYDIKTMKIHLTANAGASLVYDKNGIPSEIIGLEQGVDITLKIELAQKTIYKWNPKTGAPKEFKAKAEFQTIIGIDKPTKTQLNLQSQTKPVSYKAKTKVVMPILLPNTNGFYTIGSGNTKVPFTTGQSIDLEANKKLKIFVVPASAGFVWKKTFDSKAVTMETTTLQFKKKEIIAPRFKSLSQIEAHYQGSADGEIFFTLDKFDINEMDISLSKGAGNIVWNSAKTMPIGVKNLHQGTKVEIKIEVHDKNNRIFKNGIKKVDSILKSVDVKKTDNIGLKAPKKQDMIINFHALTDQADLVTAKAPKFDPKLYDIEYHTSKSTPQTMTSEGQMTGMDQDSLLTIQIRPKHGSHYVWEKGTMNDVTNKSIEFDGVAEYTLQHITPKFHKEVLDDVVITTSNPTKASTRKSKDASFDLSVANYKGNKMSINIYEGSGVTNKKIDSAKIIFDANGNPTQITGLQESQTYTIRVGLKSLRHTKWKQTSNDVIEMTGTTQKVDIREVPLSAMKNMGDGKYVTTLTSDKMPMIAKLPNYDKSALIGQYKIIDPKHSNAATYNSFDPLHEITIPASQMNEGWKIQFKYQPIPTTHVWKQNHYKVGDGRSDEKEVRAEVLPRFNKPNIRAAEILNIKQTKKGTKGKADAEFTFEVKYYDAKSEHIYLAETDPNSKEAGNGIESPKMNDADPKISVIPNSNAGHDVQTFRIRRMTSNRKFKLGIYLNDLSRDSFIKDDITKREKFLITTPKDNSGLTGKQIAIISLASVSLAAGTAAAISLYKIKKVGR